MKQRTTPIRRKKQAERRRTSLLRLGRACATTLARSACSVHGTGDWRGVATVEGFWNKQASVGLEIEEGGPMTDGAIADCAGNEDELVG